MSPFTHVLPPAARSLGLLALGLATLLPMLAGSMASMLLPALGADFAVPFASLQWVLGAYLLGLTCLTVVAGRLGDRFYGAACCSGAWDCLCWPACSARRPRPSAGCLPPGCCRGGAACMMVLSLAMVGQLVSPAGAPGHGAARYLSACGTALGPSFGGLLLDVAGWQLAFLALLPIGLLALVCGLFGLPRDAACTEGKGSIWRVCRSCWWRCSATGWPSPRRGRWPSGWGRGAAGHRLAGAQRAGAAALCCRWRCWEPVDCAVVWRPVRWWPASWC